MLRTFAAALVLAVPALAAHATTVTSSSIDGICNAEVVLYGSPAQGGQVVLYRGAVGRGGLNLQVYPNQGNRVCYRRAVDPHNCASPMGPQVCAPVTPNPNDTLDIR
jgi:hypothetical protein